METFCLCLPSAAHLFYRAFDQLLGADQLVDIYSFHFFTFFWDTMSSVRDH